MKSRVLYNLLSWTWGLFMTLIGHIVAVILVIAGFRSTKLSFGKYFVVGKNWGGISFGPVSIVCENPGEYLLCHEYGHSIQNCYYGPFFLILVAIPSLIRYWWRESQVLYHGKKYGDLPDYDSIWFEGQATKLGISAIKGVKQ